MPHPDSDDKACLNASQKPRLARVVDANLNRAAEALRTLEDIARFFLVDADHSSDLKRTRHALITAGSIISTDPLARAASRDAQGDPGREISTLTEGHRESIRSIALAAEARATQALRVLEEVAKLHAPNVAPDLEQLRYTSYTLAQRLTIALGTGTSQQWRLCVLITEAACTHHSWEAVAERAIAGGADCLQLREPALPDRTLLSRAERFAHLCRSGGITSFINNRADIALLAGADGVHLGQNDLPPLAARSLAGASLLLGVSPATIEQARAAARAGADVCGVGPMFPSTTKPKNSLAGLEYLRAYMSDPHTNRVPHLASSGINRRNAHSVAEAGGRGIAVCAEVCGSEDPSTATQLLLDSLGTPTAADSEHP